MTAEVMWRSNVESPADGGDNVPRTALGEVRLRPETKTVAGSFVYFAEMRAPGERPVKIGKAKRPNARVAALRTASPYPIGLLGAIPGYSRTESYLHHIFAEQRMRGEWFSESSGLRALADGGQLPNLFEPAMMVMVDGEPRHWMWLGARIEQALARGADTPNRVSSLAGFDVQALMLDLRPNEREALLLASGLEFRE